MTRAAERSVGLALAVLGVSEDAGPLDDLLSRLEEGLLLLSLDDGAVPVGLIGLDAEARAAVIESQTLGRPSAHSPEPRPSTAADAALAEPLLSAFLREMGEATAGTSLEGWVGAAQPRTRLPSAREAAMVLPDGAYRVVRLTLDLGAGGRQGLLVLLARLPRPEPAPPPEPEPALAPQVLRAEARLDAVLARVRLPLAEAERLEVGQVLPLSGITVASVRIEAGGADLGPARLGQVAGMRAIRIEAPLSPRLQEIRPEPALPLLPREPR